jgi:hypothetical protein
LEESESTEVTSNLLIPPCGKEHDVEDTAESITYPLHNYIAFVAMEIEFVASLVCFMFVLITDHTQITPWNSVRICE